MRKIRNKISFSFVLVLAFTFIQLCFFENRAEAGTLTVDSFTPADDATDIALDANLIIDFNGNWEESGTSGSITIYQNNGSVFEAYSFPAYPATVTGEGTQYLTIDPSSNLYASTSYYVQIATNILRDKDIGGGSEYGGIADTTTWSFTTVAPDTTSPTVSSFSPADNGTNILTDTGLTINFDEAIDIQTGNMSLFYMNGSLFEKFDVTSASVTGNGTSSITANPSSALPISNSFYVTVDNGAFVDNSANNFGGFSDNGTWNFTTTSSIVDWYNSSWTYRTRITINSSEVNGDLSNYPVYVDLSDLSDSFFDNVGVNGADLRVTKADGTTEIAREVVYISATDNTGELHFVANGTLSSSSDTDFYIYYGNNGASAYANGDTYGRDNVWIENFVAVWHLSESVGSASDVYDSTVNNNNGTTSGSMTSGDSVTGRVGKAFDLDGTNDMITTAVSSSTDMSGSDLTVSAWFSTIATYGSEKMILEHSIWDVSGAYQLTTTSNSNIRFNFKNMEDSVGSINHGVSFNDGNWHNVTSTFDDAANITKIYYDGSQAASKSVFQSITNGTVATYIGGRGNNSLYFTGKLDEVRLMDTARSADWIKTEYNNHNSPSTFYSVGTHSTEAVDVDAPTVSSFSPVDNGTGISITSNLVITFNENIDIQTGNLTILKVSDDSIVEAINVTSGQVTGNGGTAITINPGSDFDGVTEYYVLIDASAFDDEAGNSYVGILDNGAWSFTTAATTTLAVAHYSPAQSANTVSKEQGLVLVFNEPVQKGSGDIRIKRYSDDVLIMTIDVTSGDVTVNGNKMIIATPSLLNSNTEFYVEVDSGAFKDGSNNSYGGWTDKDTWKFNTIKYPNNLF